MLKNKRLSGVVKNKQGTSRLYSTYDSSAKSVNSTSSRNIRFGKFYRKFDKLLNPILSVAVLLFICTGVYYVFNRTDFMKVADVEVTGAKSFVNPKDVKDFVNGMVIGQNILIIDGQKVRKAVSTNFQGAGDILVAKKFPDVLTIEVVERSPLAVLSIPGEEGTYLVDKEGYVLGLVDAATTNFPVINYEGDVQIGSFVDKDMVPLYLQLIGIFDREKIKASSVSVGDREISFIVDGAVDVTLSRQKELDGSVFVLSQVLKKLSLEDKKIKHIDLRYDKVVVSYYDF